MFAYVGSRTTRERNARGNGLNVYEVDAETGIWRHRQNVADLVNPSFLAFGAAQRVLYTVHGDQSEISAFAIDTHNGHLRLLNQVGTGGKNPVHLAVDHSHRFVAVANYGSATVALLTLHSDGRLGELVDLVALPGQRGPHRVEQPHARPHHLPFDPAGRFLVVPDKGLDRIFTLRIDTERARLMLAEKSVQARETSGPRHVVFHPRLPCAYVINELDSTLATYDYDGDCGELTPRQILSALPTDFTVNSRASEIAISPDGRHLYTSNRGHDSIAIFAIDARTGLCANAGWAPSEGRTPRFFEIDPAGRFLHVANEDSDTIVSFAIDPQSGRITPTGQVIECGSPVCILFSTN